MRLSTSNSNDRIPDLPFGRIWLLVAFTAFIFFIAWDAFCASLLLSSNIPESRDNAELWSYHRGRACVDGEKAVVLIGSSRMLSLDQKKFAELVGTKPVQLAIVGESPVPVLKQFGEDDSFRGTIISEFPEYLVYQREVYEVRSGTVDAWLNAYNERRLSDDFEFWLRGNARKAVAFPQLGNTLPDALANVVSGKAFRMQTVEDLIVSRPIDLDRQQRLDLDGIFTEIEQEQLVERNRKNAVDSMNNMYQTNPPKPEKYAEITRNIETYVQRIQSRGGKVVIVNFPSSGELWRLNEIAFPRKYFWDVFAKYTSAKAIHFKDYPTLANFVCPDGSHLDAKDTPMFTENLVRIMYGKK